MSWSFFDRQDEHWALLKRNDVRSTKLAIFVHGFRGSYLSTWGDLSNYLRKHVTNESGLVDWDYLFIGYETYSISSYLGIAEIIAEQWRRASTGTPPHDPNIYRELALFGHSLGTLGIRQLLCASALHPPGLLEALRAVVLLGSPVNGSPLAAWGPWAKIMDSTQGKFAALRPGSYAISESLKVDGAPLRMLHTWNKSARTFLSGTTVHLWLGTDDQIVGDGGLVSWDGDIKRKCALDHSQICKLSLVPGQPAQGQLLDILREHLRQRPA